MLFLVMVSVVRWILAVVGASRRLVADRDRVYKGMEVVVLVVVGRVVGIVVEVRGDGCVYSALVLLVVLVVVEWRRCESAAGETARFAAKEAVVPSTLLLPVWRLEENDFGTPVGVRLGTVLVGVDE